MKIYVAKGSGFCFGVQRAMDLAYEYAEKNSKRHVYSVREIIHNPQEVKRLEKTGTMHVENVEEVKKGNHAIISTHGITPGEEAELRTRAADVLDTTCPYVKKIHKIVNRLKNEGYQVVIVGDREHYEVKGILGYAGDDGIIINSAKEAAKASYKNRVGVVSQTTQNVDEYTETAQQILKKVFASRYAEARVFNTICDATQKRQEATIGLAGKVDVMVIIGGHNSANTRRLFELSKGILKDVYHIETEKELRSRWFKNKKIIGISAGASTPERVIDAVVKKIGSMGAA
jgi:4-hydroxy-3-methylbut-2-enyl diphosphate reductase